LIDKSTHGPEPITVYLSISLNKPKIQNLEIAVKIYAVCVDLKTTDFPINTDSRIYSHLTEVFGEDSQYIGKYVSIRNVPEFYNMVPTNRKKSRLL
jgi:hypothetical protein